MPHNDHIFSGILKLNRKRAEKWWPNLMQMGRGSQPRAGLVSQLDKEQAARDSDPQPASIPNPHDRRGRRLPWPVGRFSGNSWRDHDRGGALPSLALEAGEGCARGLWGGRAGPIGHRRRRPRPVGRTTGGKRISRPALP
uniref:Uncharacterized protein n=1 Tax=Triticum urartu TaxID=4572 RepID=A0A8R7R1V5_TRIUA